MMSRSSRNHYVRTFMPTAAGMQTRTLLKSNLNPLSTWQTAQYVAQQYRENAVSVTAGAMIMMTIRTREGHTIYVER